MMEGGALLAVAGPVPCPHGVRPPDRDQAAGPESTASRGAAPAVECDRIHRSATKGRDGV